MRAARILAFCIFLFPAAAHAQRTAADIESARQLYNQGIELREKGDMKGALEKFRAAHALGNTPITGIELCKTHAALGQPVEAREVCLGVARIPPLAQETKRSEEARNEAAKIAEEQRPKIGALKLTIKGVPQGRQPTVTVDGIAVPPAAIDEPRAVNPGIHVVTAKVGTGAETRATLETKEGETKDLELTVQPPPADEAVTPPPGGEKQPVIPPKEKKNTFATVMYGVAGVSATVGVITGIIALNLKSKLDDSCKDNICGRADWQRLDDAKTLGTTSTVFFVIGGLALGTGIYASLTGNKSSHGQTNKPQVRPVIGLGGAGLDGTF